ncbi:MAG: hypothetical protein QOK36_3240, partial [Gaiellales bacterium]|nr:hypothetical protein [Gaiellales bacterium]
MIADTPSVTVNGGIDFARWSRKQVAQVAGGFWAFLIVLKFVRSAVGWSGHGALFWIVHAPLAVGFVGAGLLWVALAVRDVLGRRRDQALVRQALADVEKAARRYEGQPEPASGEELAAALLKRAILLSDLGRDGEAIAAFTNVFDRFDASNA